MSRSRFDLRDGDQIVCDEEGWNFLTGEPAQEKAARALANLAWDMALNHKGALCRQFASEVRDHIGPVVRVNFSFDISQTN